VGLLIFKLYVMSDLKSRYITMRNHKVLDASFLYDYAIHGGFKYSFEEFLTAWNLGYMDVDIMYKNLDEEYNLLSIYDTNGNFVKVIDNEDKIHTDLNVIE